MEQKNILPIQISCVKPHTKVYGRPDGIYLQTDDEYDAAVTAAKDKIRLLGRIPMTPTIKYINDECLCIAYIEYVVAARELGIPAINCHVSQVAEEDVQGEAIIATEHIEESYIRTAREVPVLLLYVEKHWDEIKRDNPKLDRKKAWVGKQIGYSYRTVEKILEVIELGKGYMLARVGVEDGFNSFEEAYKTATNKQEPPNPSDLNNNNIVAKKCNCPRAKDPVTGEECPLLAEYRRGQEGGASV